MSLSNKLETAKDKASHMEFEVTIIETLEKTITVTAKNRDEAEQMVKDNWRAGDYILDAECFTGVEFTSAPIKTDKLLNTTR
jgi:hypothetical protein